MITSKSLGQLAELVGGEVRGDPAIPIEGVAPLHVAGAQHLTWAGHSRYRRALQESAAGAVLIDRAFGETRQPALVCDDVDAALAVILDLFMPPIPAPPCGIHPSAVVDASATLGVDVAIGPHVTVGAGATIGDRTILHAGVFVGDGSTLGADCRLWPNVVVREGCRLGSRVTIHPNSVVGSDGFGYFFRNGHHSKIPHAGGVEIGDDVEIGACSCVDRSKTGVTSIGSGTKIDNLVQVAHNVEIGAHGLLCAQVGIAGSTRLGSYVVLGGQVGVRDNVAIADQVMVAACSNVAHDVSAGSQVAGSPAVELRQYLRESATVHKLPDLVARIKKLTKRIETLEAAANHKPDR